MEYGSGSRPAITVPMRKACSSLLMPPSGTTDGAPILKSVIPMLATFFRLIKDSTDACDSAQRAPAEQHGDADEHAGGRQRCS